MSNTLNIILATTGVQAVLGSLSAVKAAVGGIVSVAGGVTAALSGIRGALNFVGELNDLQARTGQQVRDLVVIRRAFDNAGIGAANTAPMIGLLQKALGGVNEEGGKTDQAFRRLGVSADALKQMGAVSQIHTLTEAFAKIENPVERTTLAMQLFGKSGAQMLQLLSDSSALGTAEREVGRLALRAQENAAKFDDLGDRLSLAKQRLTEFWIAAAEKAIPALERLADVIQAFNPGVLAAVLGTAVGIIGTFSAAKLVQKLDFAVLDWATRSGSVTGQRFAATFLAPMTGALARLLPVGLGLAIAAEVLWGLRNAWKQWRSEQVLEAKAFRSQSVDPALQSGRDVRTPEDVGKALEKLRQARSETWAKFTEASSAFFTNQDRIDAYKVALGEINSLIAELTDDWGAARIAQNQAADSARHLAEAELEASKWLKGDEAEKLRGKLAEGINSRRDPAELLENLRAYVALQERSLKAYGIEASAGRNTALNQQRILTTQAAREEVLRRIAELEQRIARTSAEAAEAALRIRLRNVAAQRSALDGDSTRTDAEKWAQRKKLLEDELAARNRIIDALQNQHDATKDPAARATLGASIRGQFDAASGVQNQIAGLGPNPNSIIDQLQSGITRLREEWGTLSQNISDTVTGTLRTAVSSISAGLTGWITKTQTWRQTLANIGSSVLNSLIGSVVELGVKMVLNGTLVKSMMLGVEALGDMLRAKRVVKENAAEAATLPAKTAGAAAAGISSFGVALAFGALAVALILGLAGAFAEGGYTSRGPKYRPAGIVHAGEWVAPQWQVDHPVYGRMIASLDAARRGGAAGYLDGGYVPEIPEGLTGFGASASVSATPAGAGAGPSAGTAMQLLQPVLVGSLAEAEGIRRGSKAEVQILELVRENRYRIFGRKFT